MTRLLPTLIAATGLALLAAAASADPIEGVWQTQPDDGAFAHVAIAPCGPAFCGTITNAYDTSGKEIATPNVNRQIVRDMVPQGGGRYEGRVWRPSNDKVYLGKIALDGNQMSLRGCVAGGLICARQTWVKVR